MWQPLSSLSAPQSAEDVIAEQAKQQEDDPLANLSKKEKKKKKKRVIIGSAVMMLSLHTPPLIYLTCWSHEPLLSQWGDLCNAEVPRLNQVAGFLSPLMIECRSIGFTRGL